MESLLREGKYPAGMGFVYIGVVRVLSVCLPLQDIQSLHNLVECDTELN